MGINTRFCARHSSTSQQQVLCIRMKFGACTRESMKVVLQGHWNRLALLALNRNMKFCARRSNPRYQDVLHICMKLGTGKHEICIARPGEQVPCYACRMQLHEIWCKALQHKMVHSALPIGTSYCAQCMKLGMK